jgi:hypothetical protein
VSPNLGIQNTIVDALARLDMPAQTLASLSGVNSSRLSRIIRGHEKIGGEDERRLRVAVAAVLKLAEFVYPIPVAWKDATRVQRCIELMQAGQLSIILQAEPIASPETNQPDETNFSPLPAAGTSSVGDDDVGRPKESLS